MGLHLCYELRLRADVSEADAAAFVSKLRDCALDMPFGAVSDVIRLTAKQLEALPRLRGLAFVRLEDVAHVTAVFSREELYARTIGREVYQCEGDVYESIRVPPDVGSVAYGFSIGVGPG
ncbi:MAG: hypothetical protein ACREOG_09250, partial [Gemmatimonadaceae bacterium]